jgi:Zn-dependent protease with chaperone function
MSQARLLRLGAAVLLVVGAAFSGALLAASVDAALFHSVASLGVVVVVVGGGIALAGAIRGASSFALGVRAARRGQAIIARHEIRPGVVGDPVPRAFCVGLLRPKVYLTSGAIAELDGDERDAVIAHERAHARRRDPLRLLLTRALADALFFCPGARQLAERASEMAEINADASADRRALASAMLRLDSVSPERVDQLLGIAPSWRIRATTMAAGGFVVAAAGLAAAVIGAQTGCWSDPFVVRSRDTTMSLMGAAPLVVVAVLFLTAPAIRERLLRRLVG